MVFTADKKEGKTTKSSKDVSPKRKSTKEKQDKSPKRNPKDASSPKQYRKSPSRTDQSKSPSRVQKSPPESLARASRPKSPGRKSPARASPARKSPARASPVQKSPARKSPGRKKSPGKSPARKSPGRKPVSAAAGTSRKAVIDVESDSDNADTLQNSEKPKAAVRGRARRLDAEKISPKVILQNIKHSTERELDAYIGVVRRSSQRIQPPEVERIVHLQHEPSVRKLSEFSDEDDIPIVDKPAPKVIEECQKIGLSYWIGALLVVSCLPLLFMSVYIFCNETHCSFTKLPSFQRYKYLSTFIDKHAFFVFSGYTLLVGILSGIPFAGPKVTGLPNKQGKLNYTLNGLSVVGVTFLTVIALEFFAIPIISIILQKYFQLLVSAIIIGVCLSLYFYVNSFLVPISALNLFAITNSTLFNFCAGRELNPRIWNKLDVKLYLYRLTVVFMILLNAIFIYNSLQFPKQTEESSAFDIRSLKINTTLLVIATLQIVYCLDHLTFEKTILSSYYVQYDGAGYFMTVSTVAGGFFMVSASKYIHDHQITLPVWQLALSVILFCCGYFLFRASNSQKYAFRQNPYNPSLSHLETLSTSQGKKLIVSGFWGYLRHPNYLGDIIIQLSFALFVLTKPPVILYLLDILYLVFRSREDGIRCKQRYGAAWDRYCQRVKYILVPKVY